MQVPAASPSGEHVPTPMYVFYQNVTTVTAEDIYKVHSEKKYVGAEPYEGAFHPTDGWLAQSGLLVPLGYLVFGMSAIPSWLFMIIISVVSRTFMYVPLEKFMDLDANMDRNRRMDQPRRPAPRSG